MQQAREYFNLLNHEYVRVHHAKEELFWSTYMGTSDDHAGFAQAESAYKDFISDPDKLTRTRAHLARVQAEPPSAERDRLLHGLQGWVRLFESHIIESPEGRSLMRELIGAEGKLFEQKRDLELFHLNERGERVAASMPVLAVSLATDPIEAHRRSSFHALRAIEGWVLDHGFLALVSLRNRLARALGFANYFDLKLQKNERMTVAQLRSVLDDFLERTDGANARTLAAMRAAHGADATAPWNLRFFAAGDVIRRLDAYMPFGLALERWIASFRRLGVQFRGATMQLDLIDRPGKHQNGFCHSPVPAWITEAGTWIPSHINFTAEAKPDQVGSGLRAINTLFHEGGHAAHFANVVQSSPCFSQEYPPTSMAYAETQSMFFDSLLGDPDWLARYARTAGGRAIPRELILERITSAQPMRAFDERAIAVVPYFEMALYELPEGELTPDRALALARETERRVLGIESPRPLLSIPHLLNQESAASYQGYLLAHMAVYQTRAYFLREHGYLTDNPAIGPALAAHYWAPGNSVDHDTTLRALTGEGFTSRYLAEVCQRSADDAAADAEAMLHSAASRTYPEAVPATLDARLRIVHGDEVIADSAAGEAAMCEAFRAWVGARYASSSAA